MVNSALKSCSILFLAIILSLCALIPIKPALALDPAKTISQYNQDAWQIEDGLPHNSIHAIAQTRDGYLWLGTEDGLVRFDGVRFTVFQKRNTPQLRDNHSRAVFEDKGGNLWIGTYGGLHLLKNGQIASYTTREGLSNDLVTSICEGRDGRLWIGTAGGLSWLKDGRLGFFTSKDGLIDDFVTALCEGTDGRLWIGTTRGLSQFKDGKFISYTTAEGLSSEHISALCESRDGSLWIGTIRGLNQLKDGRLAAFSSKKGLSNEMVAALREDSSGTLWIGTRGGLNRFSNGAYAAYTSKDGLPDDLVEAIFEDREGSLWVGTGRGGLVRLRDGKFVTYTAKEGLSSNLVRPIYEGRDGGLWIGTEDGGINRFKDGSFTSYTTKNGLPHEFVYSISEGRDGSLWVGTRGGLGRLKDGKLTSYTAKDGLAGNFIRAVLEGRDGSLWVGTENSGLSRLKDGAFTTYTTADGLSGDGVKSFCESRDGSLWIGTSQGLSLLKDGKITSYPTSDDVPVSYVFSLYEDGDGVLWIGTNGSGLVRFKDGRFTAFTTAEGLFDDLVYQILEDNSGNLWMSSNRGIFRVSKSELDGFAAGKIRLISSTSYGAADGMKSSECNTGFPAGCKTRDGKLWFPTIKGVAVIDPENIIVNQLLPPVMIEQAFIDKQPVQPIHSASLPPGSGEMEFHYTALSLLAPEKVRFKYKLEGYDQDWVEAGARRVAYYTNIPPGNYRFRVMASNNDGLWNESGASFEFYLKPHFYQTYLFYGLCAMAAALAGACLYQLRMRHLRARERELITLIDQRTQDLQEEVAERKRAEEMLRGAHDELEIRVRQRTSELAEANQALQAEVAERSRSEGALRESEAMFRALTDTVSAAIMIVRGEQIVYANAYAVSGTGYEMDELLGMNYWDIVHPDFKEIVRERGLARQRGEEMSLHYELKALNKKGEEAWFYSTAVMINYQGQPAMLLTGFDITERKRTEEALRASEEKYRDLVEDLQEVIYAVGENGEIIYISPAIETFSGYTPSEVVGRSFTEFVHPEDLPRTFESFLKNLQGINEPNEFRVLARSGEIRWVQSSGKGVFTGERVTSVHGVITDITERKRAEEEQARLQMAIQSAATEWRLTFDSIESPVLMLNMDGRVRRMNRAAQELAGGDYEEKVGRLVSETGSGEPWQKAAEVVKLIQKTRAGTSCQVRDNLTARTWDIAASLFAGDGADDGRIILEARDISRMVELQESLRRNETMSAMGQLVAGVAHEVRNPLFGISATLDAFEASFGASESYKRYLQVLRGELNRLSDLMKDLLDYGRPPGLELSQAAIGDVIDRAIESCAPLAEQSKVRIDNKVSRELGPLMADKKRLIQVFCNLVENAVQHSPRGGSVFVEAEEMNQNGRRWLECRISDSGPGIREEDMAKLFEPFFTRRRGGTGLGLSIVQRIVEQHGGAISAGNKAEGGAQITVRLPIAAFEADEDTVPQLRVKQARE